jgi:flagellar basal body-associated protein FliL
MKNIHKIILIAVLAGAILLAFMMFSKKSKFGEEDEEVLPTFDSDDPINPMNNTVFIVLPLGADTV